MAKGKAKPMVGTKHHSLSDLVGKKIKSITMEELDVSGEGDTRQFYHLTCSDGDEFVMACESGNSSQATCVELMDPEEFEEFRDNIGHPASEEDEDGELDEDFDDEEALDDEEDDGFFRGLRDYN